VKKEVPPPNGKKVFTSSPWVKKAKETIVVRYDHQVVFSYLTKKAK